LRACAVAAPQQERPERLLPAACEPKLGAPEAIAAAAHDRLSSDLRNTTNPNPPPISFVTKTNKRSN